MNKILLRILNKFKKKVPQKSRYEVYKEKGWLEVGENSSLDNLSISRSILFQQPLFVQIGKDSLIGGNYISESSGGFISIGDHTFVGSSKFISAARISIGNDVLISWGCTFMDTDAHSVVWEERKNDVKDWKKGFDENQKGKFKDWAHVKSRPIVVEDKSWIGFNCIILKGVTIGEGAIVAAGSVVTKDVAPFTVVAGNPAQFVKDLKLQ